MTLQQFGERFDDAVTALEELAIAVGRIAAVLEALLIRKGNDA
jgi:hypothetical protein